MIARAIAGVICAHREHDAQAVWEPFCGGLNVTRALCAAGVDVIATDASVPLIALIQAVRSGWLPPSTLDEPTWRAWRALPAEDPRHGFAGFTCFGGMYFAGYARNGRGRNYAAGNQRALLRDAPLPAYVARVDFLAREPEPLDVTIYCDPPYRGTAGYRSVGPFDSDRFERRVAGWSRYCNVLVSERAFPFGEIVYERYRSAHLRGRETQHLERVYFVAKGSL